jgi:hypothetical protein
MHDQLSSAGGVLMSPDLFTVIDNEIAPVAHDLVILDVKDCPPGITATVVTLARVREMLNSRDTPDPVCDALWAVLVRRARMEPRPWQRMALWVMVPRLRSIVRKLRLVWDTDEEDVRSEVVAGFLEVLRQTDPDRPEIGKRLWWKTFRVGHQMCRQAVLERVTADMDRLADRSSVDAKDSPLPMRTDMLPGRRIIESERLGSLAARLGLRAVVENRPTEEDPGRVVFLSADRGRPRPHNGHDAGTGTGEAA